MSFRRVLRYRFDNLMSRGVLAQILLLAVVTTILVMIGTFAIVLLDLPPAPEAGKEADTFGLTTWKSLMRAMDPGTLAGDSGSWSYLFVLLFLTIGGIFVLSALIGVLNNGFGQMLERLRRGRSVVIEKGHTVILGWTPKVHTLLGELVEANRNQRNACIVILANRDKVDMDAEAIATIAGSKTRLRVVTRSGDPMKSDDLALVSLATSRAVIVLAPEVGSDGAPMAPHESDTVVLKTLLALAKASEKPLHVVAEVYDPRSEAVARMVAGKDAALILAMPLISRLLVQTGRQSGLSVVYTELLDFAGSEIYVKEEPALAGTTFAEATRRYDTSSVIGVLTKAGETLVPPSLDRRFAPGDSVIAISEDDDTVVLDGAKTSIDDHQLVVRPKTHIPEPERTLVLGAGPRLQTVLRELDAYVAPGSETLVVGEQATELPKLEHMKCAFQLADLTDRGVLEALNVTSFDHILALSETVGRTQDMADARTMVTLLHLRDLERIAGKKVPITSEILDINNRDLATISEADDFIVSNTLISLMVSQVAENPHLVRVFDELFGAEGHEIYLKPATDYVKPGKHSFATVCESALRRNEIAIGYRLDASSNDQAAAYGVTINPAKRTQVALGAGDKVIVLAEA